MEPVSISPRQPALQLRSDSSRLSTDVSEARRLFFIRSTDFLLGVQRELKYAGYDPGMMEGQQGPETIQALKRFQEAHGLSPRGELDIPTLTKLVKQSLQR
jgi:hypothetical protein